MADRDGFEGVTLRRIAAELGVHVTSLYNHVPTRDAVTDGIIERLIEEAKLPTSPVPWEEWVRSFKYNCRPPFPLNLVSAPKKPAGAKVLVFHGKPDPPDAVTGIATGKIHHRVLPSPWVAEHWRE